MASLQSDSRFRFVACVSIVVSMVISSVWFAGILENRTDNSQVWNTSMWFPALLKEPGGRVHLAWTEEATGYYRVMYSTTSEPNWIENEARNAVARMAEGPAGGDRAWSEGRSQGVVVKSMDSIIYHAEDGITFTELMEIVETLERLPYGYLASSKPLIQATLNEMALDLLLLDSQLLKANSCKLDLERGISMCMATNKAWAHLNAAMNAMDEGNHKEVMRRLQKVGRELIATLPVSVSQLQAGWKRPTPVSPQGEWSWKPYITIDELNGVLYLFWLTADGRVAYSTSQNGEVWNLRRWMQLSHDPNLPFATFVYGGYKLTRSGSDATLFGGDDDDDGDGLTNSFEDSDGSGTYDPLYDWSNFMDPDTDDDGLWDGWIDSNGNKNWDPGEKWGEWQWKTDPKDPDSDDDQLLDGEEIVDYKTSQFHNTLYYVRIPDTLRYLEVPFVDGTPVFTSSVSMTLSPSIYWTNDQRISLGRGTSHSPEIVMLDDGSLHIAWIDERNGNPQIFYRRSPDGGHTWEEETPLTVPSETAPLTLSFSGEGSQLIIAWGNSEPGRDYSKIKTLFSPDRGTTWIPQRELQDARDPSIDIDDGVAYLFYQYYYQHPELRIVTSYPALVWWDVSAPDTLLGTVTLLDSGVGVGSVFVENSDLHLGMASDSGSVLYYHSLDGGVVWNQWALSIGSVSGPLDHGMIDIAADTPEVGPDLATDVYVLWHSEAGSSIQLRYAHSGDGGADWDPDLSVTSSAGDSMFPDMLLDNNLDGVELQNEMVRVVYQDNSDGYWRVYETFIIGGSPGPAVARTPEGVVADSPHFVFTGLVPYQAIFTLEGDAMIEYTSGFAYTWQDWRFGATEVVARPARLYPSGVSIDVGDDGDLEFLEPGIMMESQTVTNLENEVNEYLEGRDEGDGVFGNVVLVPIRIASRTGVLTTHADILFVESGNNYQYTDPHDPDSDDDGVSDYDERGWMVSVEKTGAHLVQALPILPDSDQDGMPDGEERSAGTSAMDADYDYDLANDWPELHKGTDPLLSEGDGDAILDGDELFKYLLDPHVSDADADKDGDGIANVDEYQMWEDVREGLALSDIDQDGTFNLLDADSDNDGLLDGEEKRYWVSVEADFHKRDVDQDGVPNIADSDSDNDGFLDGDEFLLDGDPASVDLLPHMDDTDDDGMGDPEEFEYWTVDRHLENALAVQYANTWDSDGGGIPDG